MKKLPSILIVILLGLTGITIIPLEAHASQLNVHIEGPTVLATNQTAKYKVYVEGYFNLFRCGVIIAGYNLTGAKPTNFFVTSSKDGHFVFNVTAPNVPQTVELYFIAYGMLNSTTIGAKASRVLYVEVKKAIDINVKIKNTENYAIYNTVISFYIDGRYIGNTTVKVIKANATKNIDYKWLPQELYNGKHQLTVKISGKGVVFENGQQNYVYNFYYGKPPSYDYITYLSGGVLALVIVFFLLMLLARKGKKSGPPPKWKK